MRYNTYPCNTGTPEFDWDTVPLDTQLDGRAWGPTVVRMAGGAEVRLAAASPSILAQTVELDA